ncbi:MAG: nucleoside-diphosphate kinase [Deltaproteobacteria bacterium]|nr:nucleoside-diphosphate kinase [Deltaproteobacteria bacterium]
MAVERTLGIVKPDAVKNNYVGKILAHATDAGLRIVGLRLGQLTVADARAFYEVHKERPFYPELVESMSGGPTVVVAFEGENAIARWREIMGATNPAQAAEGTIRKLYAESHTANAVHGSDSTENAAREIAFFFSATELF